MDPHLQHLMYLIVEPLENGAKEEKLRDDDGPRGPSSSELICRG